jgi:protein-disulfide isomerase
MSKNKNFKKYSIILSLFISLLVLSACNNFDDNLNNTNTNNPNLVGMKYYRKGAKNPIVILEEYSDFFCPHCGTAQPVLDLLLEEYPDKLALEYHHYSFMGSEDVHVANECAGQQDKFWEYHELAWEKQYDLSAGGKKALVNLAIDLNLDKTEFEKCLIDKKIKDWVETSRIEGRDKYGINATPTFVVNKKVIEMTNKGLYETLKEAIEKAMKSPLA